MQLTQEDIDYFVHPVAIYTCQNCGTDIPVEFTNTDEEDLPEVLEKYPCGKLWGGCGLGRTLNLSSDGYADLDEAIEA